MEWWQK